AVIGVPHPDFGETVVGVLVANGSEDLDLDAIKKNIGGSLARFKHPQRLIVLPELPRNTMGKVQKKELREQYKDMFTPAQAPQ
ncbi:MAG: malonyl-CoA synthase, partial [Pseudomonadota bacterium]